jgi:hypothetical protein
MTDPKSIRKMPKPSVEAKGVPARQRKAAGGAVASSPAISKGEAATRQSVAAKAKQKLVRDSFTMPKPEYSLLEGLKERATNLRRPTKKSELLRAGVAVLHAMTDKAFLSALGKVTSLKTGRPKGSKAAAKPATGSDV